MKLQAHNAGRVTNCTPPDSIGAIGRRQGKAIVNRSVECLARACGGGYHCGAFDVT